MTLFGFRGAKGHEWTFCDPIRFSILTFKAEYNHFTLACQPEIRGVRE